MELTVTASKGEVQSPPPVMTIDGFASWVCATNDTVRGWVQSGVLPSCKIGRRRYIDVVQFMSDLRKGKGVFSQGDYE